MEGSSGQGPKEPRQGGPPDSDLIGIPVVLGVALAFLAALAAFVLIGPMVGLLVVIAAVVIGLLISFREIRRAEIED